jgi:hypothetical protein
MHGEKQSCEVSLKFLQRFWRCNVDKLILLKNRPLRAITVPKNQAENQESMHNKASVFGDEARIRLPYRQCNYNMQSFGA